MLRLRTVLTLFVLFATASAAFGQGPPNPPENREAMWPAATAEGWKKPVLITFQRTWDDAVAVARETNRPILACINMDGEIASEHYAGIRYRDPETAKLYEPYVCVIASVYRHNPRDYDDEGNRTLCPRFGSVTCGEHIAIEPILYEKFLDEERVAPRHIMIEPDGEEVYDVYYRNDVASVLDDIRKGIEEREEEPRPIVRGDRSLVERVAGRDIRDRRAVEAAYKEGDADLRRSLLEAAKKLEGRTPLDLLRLAVFGLDTQMSELARESLAKTENPKATDLIVDALQVPLQAKERQALVDALERLGRDSERARWLASVQEGLAVKGSRVDSAAWSKGGGTYQAPLLLRSVEDLERYRAEIEKAYEDAPGDANSLLTLAEASFALALKAQRLETEDPRMAQVFARHLLEDAAQHAREAKNLPGADWRADTLLALSAYYRGNKEDSYDLAAQAVSRIPPGDTSWNSMALLTVFAEGRYKKIKRAARERRRWRGQWLADLDSAYNALLHHPQATESAILWHYDFLMWLGANYRAKRFLYSCLERFPESPQVHSNLRQRVLEDRGHQALEAEYEALAEREDPPRNIEWFAGYASLVAAEYERRATNPEAAAAAYDRAIEHYARAVEANPETTATSDHYVALALAGKARLALEAEDWDAAVAAIVASFERRADSAGTMDGMGITPAETAQMLLARLTENDKAELASKLEAAMAALDPEHLKPREE